jgi:hypothetical protein
MDFTGHLRIYGWQESALPFRFLAPKLRQFSHPAFESLKQAQDVIVVWTQNELTDSLRRSFRNNATTTLRDHMYLLLPPHALDKRDVPIVN